MKGQKNKSRRGEDTGFYRAYKKILDGGRLYKEEHFGKSNNWQAGRRK